MTEAREITDLTDPPTDLDLATAGTEAAPERGPRRLTSWRAVDTAALALLMVASFGLRVGDLDGPLWIDEGISVGIASHSLAEIPTLLARDGSPPLYYLLLHGWMAVFGSSEPATHTLSLALSLVTVPVALWAGWSLFGRRIGWILAALFAFSPYVSYFATETRMYALVMLAALVATASFLHAFAYGRRRYRWAFAVSLVMVLYSHNWGIWLAAAAAAALVPCAAASSDRRRVWRDAATCFGLAGLAYLPWVPTLVFQAAHTGAPWSPQPVPREMISLLADVLGDPHERVLVALLLVAGPALWASLRRGKVRPVVVAVATLAAVPVVLGWIGAQVSPSWAPRYLVVVTPAVLLLAALGLSWAGARGLVALALIAALWVQPFARLSGVRPSGVLSGKATVRPLARAAAPGLEPGDLVIAMQMEEVPVLAYYLPRGLRFATATGPVLEPGVADWRDALDRTAATTVATALLPQLDRAGVGTDVLLVCAQPGTGPMSLPWFALMVRHCAEWRTALEADARFAPVPVSSGGPPPAEGGRPVLQFTKTGQ